MHPFRHLKGHLGLGGGGSARSKASTYTGQHTTEKRGQTSVPQVGIRNEDPVSQQSKTVRFALFMTLLLFREVFSEDRIFKSNPPNWKLHIQQIYTQPLSELCYIMRQLMNCDTASVNLQCLRLCINQQCEETSANELKPCQPCDADSLCMCSKAGRPIINVGWTTPEESGCNNHVPVSGGDE
jgi:hypothetical protein